VWWPDPRFFVLLDRAPFLNLKLQSFVPMFNFARSNRVAHVLIFSVKDFDPVRGDEWPANVSIQELESKLRREFPGGLQIAVFLPPLTTLKVQTVNRLEKNHKDLVDWGCTMGDGTVMFYSVKGDSFKSYKRLMDDICKRDDKLFLLIADECHRGVLVKGAADADDAVSADDAGAHHHLLNHCDIATRRNVIIADVSATPYVSAHSCFCR
jgi:hypothetical protein